MDNGSADDQNPRFQIIGVASGRTVPKRCVYTIVKSKANECHYEERNLESEGFSYVLTAFTEGGAPLSLPRFAMICCGPRTDEILVLLKTFLLFSQDEHVEVFIIADEVAQPLIGAGVKLVLSYYSSSS